MKKIFNIYYMKELKEFIDAGADEASAVEWVEKFVEKW